MALCEPSCCAVDNYFYSRFSLCFFATNNTDALRADEDRNRQILERIPAGRWGDPADLGGAAVFLASAASDYVHGTLLPVDGGWMAR